MDNAIPAESDATSAAPQASGPSIAVTSPAEGAQVSNPVALAITTSEPFTVARIQVWDHGVKILDQQNSRTVNSSILQMTSGAHSLTINVKDGSMETRDSTTLNFQVQ